MSATLSVGSQAMVQRGAMSARRRPATQRKLESVHALQVPHAIAEAPPSTVDAPDPAHVSGLLRQIDALARKYADHVASLESYAQTLEAEILRLEAAEEGQRREVLAHAATAWVWRVECEELEGQLAIERERTRLLSEALRMPVWRWRERRALAQAALAMATVD